MRSARVQSNPFPEPFPASSMTMSAGDLSAASISSGVLAMNVLITGACVSARRPWMYISSSDPWSCTMDMVPSSTRSAMTRGSSSTKTPTVAMDGSISVLRPLAC